jgi:hypothetical protein
MPALPAVPGVIKCQLTCTIGNDTNAMCRFYIRYAATAPTPAQLTTFAAAIATAWAANMPITYPPASSLTGVFCEDLTTSSSAIGAWSGSVIGTNGGGIIPNAAAAMMQFLIARRYRGGKPKVFLPIGAASDIGVGGVWLPAFITAATAAFQTFMAAVIAAAWPGAGLVQQASVSYYNGFNPVQNPITGRWRNVPRLRLAPLIDDIIGIVMEAGIASQRRRNQV